MKIILDSNVCVVALATRGLCSALMELCLSRYELISSRFILNEIKRTLTEKIKINSLMVGDIISYLSDHFIICDYDQLEKKICRDADDDEILALAKTADCDFIITGDKDLLILKKYSHTRIVDPRQFWEYVRQQG